MRLPRPAALAILPLPPSLHCLCALQAPVLPSSEGKEWTGRPHRSGQALLTFPQRVQAVEHELVDGAADGAVVQRGRAAPSGQHGRKLSRKEPHRPQWAPVQTRGGATWGGLMKSKDQSLLLASPLPSPQQESYSASLLSLPSTLPQLVSSTYQVIPQALDREQTMYIKNTTFLRVSIPASPPSKKQFHPHTSQTAPLCTRTAPDSPQRTSWCSVTAPPPETSKAMIPTYRKKMKNQQG